jgi:RHS repeat-associated protein
MIRLHRTTQAVGVFLLGVLAALNPVHAAGDVFDQFFRHTETRNKVFVHELPGETVDPFTGTLRLIQTDLVLPGKAGLDLRIVRSYSSKIWGRSDALDMEPLLAEKERTVLGYGWSLHMGRLRNPHASGQSGICSGDFPVYEAPDGSSHVFYPAPGSNTLFFSKDYWRMEKGCAALSGNGACVWTSTGQRLEFSNASANQFFMGTTPVWPASGIVDSHNNRISVAYVADQSGAVSSITDTYNRTVTFSYTTDVDGKRLASITANNNVYTYSYTAYTGANTSGTGRIGLPGKRRFLTEVTPPSGPSYSYTYGYQNTLVQNQYALTSLTLPSGGTTTYTYGNASFFTGRETVPFSVVTGRTVGGRAVTPATWSYAYVSPASGTALHTTTITRPDGKKDIHKIHGFGFVAGKNATGSTWMVGLPAELSHADGAEVETFSWNAGNSVSNATYSAPAYSTNCGPYMVWDTSVTAPVMTQRKVTRNGVDYTTTFSNFDAYGQAKTVTEAGQQTRTTTLTYFYALQDGSGKPLNLVHGRPLTQRVCIGTDCVNSSWTYTGPGYARNSETLAGTTTTYGHSSDGNVSTVTNALGQTLTLSGYTAGHGIPTTANFNNAFTITRTAYWEGRLKSETNGRGDITEYTYDKIGRPTSITPPGANVATTYTYASDGSSSTLTRGTFTQTTNVDGLGRTTSVTDSTGRVSTLRYDTMGRTSFKSYPYDSTLNETGERFEYDGLGRVTTITRGYRPATNSCDAPGACTLTNVYAQNCVTTTEQRASGNNVTKKHCFLSFGDPNEQRLREVTDGNSKTWEYAYSTHGKLKTFTTPLAKGNRSFTYDSTRQFQTGETTAETGTITYGGHNDIGQVGTRTDARGITATYGYNDPLSRLRSVSYGTGSSENVTMNYDDDHNLTLLASVAGGTFDYDYDELNRLETQTWTYEGRTYTTSYGYNSAGCLTSMTYPTGTTLTLTCDAANRVTSVSVGSSTIASNVTYHPSDRVKAMTYGNTLATSAVFDARGRLDTLTTPGVVALDYGYDGVNNVTSFNNAAVSGASRTMQYDKLNRLEVSTAPSLWGTAAYSYDELGNRTLASVGSFTTTYTYDAKNRLATADGPHVPAVMTLNWNHAGQVASTSDGATYHYDGRGNRVKKTTAGGATLYHYDAAGRLISETLPTGERLRDYFYVADRLVAVEGCQGSSAPPCTERQWLHTDLTGSVLARTNAAGAVVARFDYQPWGERWTSTDAASRQYNGRVLDGGTGFYDYGARMYAPTLGRFISRDTAWPEAGNPQGSNGYAYVFNSPYGYTDPSGRVPFLVVTGIGGALVGAGWAAISSYEPGRGVDWGAVAKGAAIGGAIGATLGAGTAAYVAGSATATTTEVVYGGGLMFAALVGGAGSSSGKTVLYHGGTLKGGAVNGGKFSTTPDLAHATKYMEQYGGKIYRFEVPTRWILDMEKARKAQFLRDHLKGTDSIADEWQFWGDAAVKLNDFLIK